MKFLEENRPNLHGLGLHNSFLHVTPKSQKEKVDKIELYKKKKNLCVSKEMIKEVKGQPREWKKNICKSYRDLYPEYIKNGYIQWQKDNPIKKWVRHLNRHFPKNI